MDAHPAIVGGISKSRRASSRRRHVHVAIMARDELPDRDPAPFRLFLEDYEDP